MSRDMVNREDAAIAASVRALNEELARDSEHPSNDELLGYHERSLADEDAERIRQHVALCPECARRGLDLAAFVQEDALDEEDRPTDRAVRASWNTLRANLREEGILSTSEGSSAGWLGSLLAGKPFGSLRFAYALAGVFFLTTVSTSVWLVKEQRMVTALSRPASFQLVDLLPDSVLRRPSSAAGTKVHATPDDLAFSLGLLEDLTAEGPFRAKVFDLRQPDAAMWTVEPLPRDPDGFFSLKIPGRSMPAGRYEIRIYALDDRLLAGYSFQIVEP